MEKLICKKSHKNQPITFYACASRLQDCTFTQIRSTDSMVHDYLFPVSKRICEVASGYKSRFHPVSLARKTVCKLTLSLLKWQDLPNPFADEFSGLESSDEKLSTQIADATRACEKLITSVSLSEDNVSKLFPLQFDLGKVYTFVEVVVELLNMAQLPTLYMPKEEIDVAVVLRNIVQHGIVISGQASRTNKLYL